MSLKKIKKVFIISNSEKKQWYVYILRCSDGSLYTGITTDLERRVSEHNHSKKAAAYTRARRPVCLVYAESRSSRADASRREYEIKQLSRREKLALKRNIEQ